MADRISSLTKAQLSRQSLRTIVGAVSFIGFFGTILAALLFAGAVAWFRGHFFAGLLEGIGASVGLVVGFGVDQSIIRNVPQPFDRAARVKQRTILIAAFCVAGGPLFSSIVALIHAGLWWTYFALVLMPGVPAAALAFAVRNHWGAGAPNVGTSAIVGSVVAGILLVMGVVPTHLPEATNPFFWSFLVVLMFGPAIWIGVVTYVVLRQVVRAKESEPELRQTSST